MRIVYNLRDQDWQTTKSLGILHVSTRLLTGLATHPAIQRIDVFANPSLRDALLPFESSPRVCVHFLRAATPRRWSRLLWDNWSLTRATQRLSPDWLLLPKGFSPLVSQPRCRLAAFVHDTIFEYYHNHTPRPFPRGELTLFTAMLRRTARSASVVATNSNFTAERFRHHFNPRGRVVRIGAPSLLAAPLPPPTATSNPVSSLLLPTSSWPHKLTTQAIAWLTRWTTEQRFAGTVHGFGGLPSGVGWPRDARWHHHGRISPKDLQRLEVPESLLVYFSAYEGYGLPPIEALAASRRAVASDLPPLRETLPSQVLFQNDSYESFARVLKNAIATGCPQPLQIDTANDSAARWVSALQAHA